MMIVDKKCRHQGNLSEKTQSSNVATMLKAGKLVKPPDPWAGVPALIKVTENIGKYISGGHLCFIVNCLLFQVTGIPSASSFKWRR